MIAYRVNKNKEITSYYIHRALKFTTSDNKAEPDSILHTLGIKIATSANKHADKIIYRTDSNLTRFKKG
jgi:hypothetical protein